MKGNNQIKPNLIAAAYAERAKKSGLIPRSGKTTEELVQSSIFTKDQIKSGAWKDVLTPKNREEQTELDILMLMTKFIDYIQPAIEKADLSRNDLATLTGISEKRITGFFCGDNTDLEILVRLCRVLNLEFKITI